MSLVTGQILPRARPHGRINFDDEPERHRRRRPCIPGKHTVTSVVRSVLPWVGLALTAVAMAYGVIACIAVRRRARTPRLAPRDPPAVTILKPLCGAEPETYECLRSFCDQAYPEFQVVFGVCDSNDPVLGIVDRLKEEFPQRDLQVVIDRRQHGSSRKVSNLINMMAACAPRIPGAVGQRCPGESRLSCASRGAASRCRRRHRHLRLPRVGATKAYGRSWGPCSSMNGSFHRSAWRPWPDRDRSHPARPSR